MRTHSPLLLAGLASILLLSACSSGPKIIANQDPNTDFSAYRTFEFADPLSTDRGGMRSILSTHLMTETARQLDARGFRRQRTIPDVYVDFGASAVNKIQSTGSQPSTSVSMSRGYGSRGGTSTSVGVGFSTGSSARTTTEGTVVISMIDRKRNQVVWEVTASGRVDDKTKKNMEPAVRAAVEEMFAKFPVPPKP